jgi:hypothetical protein
MTSPIKEVGEFSPSRNGGETGAATLEEARHSPGPWSLSRGMGASWNGATVWSGSTKIATLTRKADKAIDQKAADARLIAAAPELLEALRWFIEDIDGFHTVMVGFDANVERARAAIAKATSEPQPRAPQTERDGSRDEINTVHPTSTTRGETP